MSLRHNLLQPEIVQMFNDHPDHSETQGKRKILKNDSFNSKTLFQLDLNGTDLQMSVQNG